MAVRTETARASLYRAFRETLFPIRRLREPAPFHEPIPVTERLVQAIWADQIFDARHLHTRDGEPIQILHAGTWNSEGGPDFCNAKIRIGNHTRCGDVEIHLHATGWKEHQHEKNPAYDRVILDVCLWDLPRASGAVTSRGEPVPQLVLHPHLQSSLDELLESLDPDRYPMTPARVHPRDFLQDFSKTELIAHVESAALYRFEQKVDRIRDEIARSGASQVAYQLLAEALGYKHNKFVFREIARHLSWERLRRMPNVDDRIELLLSEATRHPIRLGQVRPANHPQRRLAALAILTARHPDLPAWFQQLVFEFKKFPPAPRLEHPFWSFRYSAQGNALRKPISLLGSERWLEILTNVILPFCSAQTGRDKPREEQLLNRYMQLPASQPNRASRKTGYDLGLPEPLWMFQQQGLLQIAQDAGFLKPRTP